MVRAGKTPYVRFDLNDYSIPHTHVRRTLELLATLDTVRVLNGAELIAVHARSYDRGAQIEDPAHIQALLDHKRSGRAHRAMDRLHHATPSVGALFKLAAERGVIWAHSPAASSICSTPTVPRLSRTPWSQRSPRMPRTWAPCVTSSICSAPGAGPRHPSR